MLWFRWQFSFPSPGTVISVRLICPLLGRLAPSSYQYHQWTCMTSSIYSIICPQVSSPLSTHPSWSHPPGLPHSLTGPPSSFSLECPYASLTWLIPACPLGLGLTITSRLGYVPSFSYSCGRTPNSSLSLLLVEWFSKWNTQAPVCPCPFQRVPEVKIIFIIKLRCYSDFSLCWKLHRQCKNPGG